MEDLDWLGLAWDEPVVRQSERAAAHSSALARLEGMGLVYPCFCTRKEIAVEIAAAGAAPHGPEGAVYPGTCRGLAQDQAGARMADGAAYALRLDVARAAALVGDLQWRDRTVGVVAARPERFGDIVLARKDAPASYHLAVVVDDAAAGVTLATRGRDLFEATDVQVLLQRLLELPTPNYLHHGLVMGADGKRLAKRDLAATIAAMREAGETPEAVLEAARSRAAADADAQP